MTAINEKSTHSPSVDAPIPALWHEAAPRHFDRAVPSWAKAILVIVATLIALQWLDLPIAHWALLKHPIPDLANPNAQHNDIARELMMLEQWGQWVGSVLVIVSVAMIDKAGPRRALAIAMGCLVTVFVCYVLKDLIGRSRPPVVGDGSWIWGGPAQGFRNGSPWGSFPSAHTTGAFALSVGLSWFYPRARGLFMGIAVITAIQRVLHAAHYVSDVVAGMGIAVFFARWTLHAKLAGRIIAIMPPRTRDWFLRENE